jgi:hypothetical protein
MLLSCSLNNGPSDGMADIRDLKSRGEKSPCGFDSRLGHSTHRTGRLIIVEAAAEEDGGYGTG